MSPHFVRAQLSQDKHFLLIHGMMHRDVPSICVFQIIPHSKFKFRLIMKYSDSILGVSAATLNSNGESIYAIPRSLTGFVSEIHLQIANQPTEYEHRMIQDLRFASSQTTSMNHIRIAPPNPSNIIFITWSEDEMPTIGLWTRFDSEQYECIEYTFTVPVLIKDISFSQDGKSLGLVLMVQIRTILAVWNIENGHFTQYNYLAPRFGDLSTAKWGSSMMGLKTESYIAIGSGCIMEHITSSVKFWNHPQCEMTNFIDINQTTRFYMNKNKELHVIDLTDIDRRLGPMPINPEVYPPFSFLKARIKGTCESASGMHLYRCCKCRIPLVHPLVSRSEDGMFSQCYCSRECQMKHWPIYIASQQSGFVD